MACRRRAAGRRGRLGRRPPDHSRSTTFDNTSFRVPSNTVVLIDEPELSLHVGWQKKFLSDLTAIVELSGLDAVVATHSPFIVGDRDDLLVGLGD